MATDDPARLRAALDQIANALQPAVIIADHLERTTGTIAQDAASLSQNLRRAAAILKSVPPPGPSGDERR